MTKKILFGLIVILVSSCTTVSYDYVDPFDFNESIDGRVDIKNGKDLINIFYNFPEEEGSTIMISESRRRNKVVIVLIHDRLADDSVRAAKIIMIAKQSGSQWVVLEIKKQIKCYEGRGHTEWGTEPCG